MKRVTIAGLGLIGGSAGMALRRRGWRVAYIDPAVDLEAALRAEAADERLERLEGELVVLATPVDAAIAQLRELRSGPALVTSVCSVMQPLREAAGGLRFVAGHPFAGSERSGLSAARHDLFEGRTWFVDRGDARVEELIADCGATPVLIDAAEHDRILAITSHLPQLLSTALGSMLVDIDPRFVGSGALSLLRLAGSSHRVWAPVLEANAANIGSAVEELLSILKHPTASDFEKANRVHRKAVKGPDKPGG